MNKENDNKLKVIKGDEIDLVALFRVIWLGRKVIYKSICICVLISLLIGFFSSDKYTAQATLLPSQDNESMGSMGGIGALAGMAGINISSMMGGNSNGIQADIYPQVVESYPFKRAMMHQEFNYLEYDKPITIYEYILSDTIPSFGDKVLMYTLKLPWTLKKAFSSQEEYIDTTNYGVINLSPDDVVVLESLEQFFEVEVDAKSGLISISAEDYEPILVAQKVQKALDLLQNYVQKHKTKLEKQNVDFLEDLYLVKESEYKKAQADFFAYKDKHRNTVIERANFDLQQLSEKYDMASSIFKSIAQQLEQAKVTLAESVPVFTVLEPVKVPINRSWPKRSLLLVISLFLGFFIGIGVIIGQRILLKFRRLL